MFHNCGANECRHFFWFFLLLHLACLFRAKSAYSLFSCKHVYINRELSWADEYILSKFKATQSFDIDTAHLDYTNEQG
ncbi:hypothetical protein BDV34DRAFT_41710 [Aspergillus parasiticus]|uniref:Secreted protein n=1 Tax=Aspergillus parasiticus TaxID=5067 RepID=A0A5N6D269_ASPPA|nr:hypothetical protein BDV34DRAFT_41710 [Aspergillus parasiticus]